MKRPVALACCILTRISVFLTASTLLRFNALTFQFATVAESAKTLQTSLGNDLKYCGGGASAFTALLIYAFMSCAYKHSQSDFSSSPACACARMFFASVSD